MIMASLKRFCLTLWGSVTHVCISKLTIIGSDNGVPPGGSQVIIWTTDETLLIETLGTNFSEILNEIHTFSFKKIHLKMSPVKWRPFCLGVNVSRSSQSPCNHMTSWHGVAFRIICLCWEESIRNPFTKGPMAQTFGDIFAVDLSILLTQTVDLQTIWKTLTFVRRHCSNVVAMVTFWSRYSQGN